MTDNRDSVPPIGEMAIGQIKEKRPLRYWLSLGLSALVAALNLFAWRSRYGGWWNLAGVLFLAVAHLRLEWTHYKLGKLVQAAAADSERAFRLIAHGCCPNGHGALQPVEAVLKCPVCHFVTNFRPRDE